MKALICGLAPEPTDRQQGLIDAYKSAGYEVEYRCVAGDRHGGREIISISVDEAEEV